MLPQGYSGADLASLMREAAMCALKESLAKDRANGGQVIARSDSLPRPRAMSRRRGVSRFVFVHKNLALARISTFSSAFDFLCVKELIMNTPLYFCLRVTHASKVMLSSC